MRGRKPQPARLRLLKMPTGRKGRKAAPRGGLSGGGPLGLADAPPEFTPEERQVWREIIESAPPGLLRKLDRQVVAMLATTTWLIQRVKSELEAEELTVPTQRGGSKRNPHMLSLGQLAQLQLKLAAELGLTPVSRLRLNLPAEPARPNPFLEVLRDDGPKRGGGRKDAGPEGGGAPEGGCGGAGKDEPPVG